MSTSGKPPHNRSFRLSRVESLENRRLLAAFELSSLLPAEGGDGSAGFVVYGPPPPAFVQYSDHCTISSLATGDINNDGYADLLVAARRFNASAQTCSENNQLSATGAVFVVYGTSLGIPSEIDLLSLDGRNGFVIYGNPEDEIAGDMLASDGDLNGDGVDDIALTAVFTPLSGGRAYVLFGNAAWGKTEFPAEIQLQSLLPSHGGDGSRGFVIDGIEPGDLNGWNNSGDVGGDVNGDGISDLVVGSAGAYRESAGKTFVVFGRDTDSNGDGILDDPFPAEFDTSTLKGSIGLVINGANAGDWAGYAVSTKGDLNGDQIDDIVIGAPQATPDGQGRTGAGQTFVVYGAHSFPDMLNLDSILSGDGSQGFVINGIAGAAPPIYDPGRDVSGASVHSGGDFNGDGYSDLVIGAPRAAREAGLEVGEGYLLFGRGPDAPPFPPVIELLSLDGSNGFIVTGVHHGDVFANHVALADFNGDGLADFISTAPGGDPGGRTDAGETFVIFGTRDLPQQAKFDLDSIVSGDDERGLVINGVDAGDSSGGYSRAVNSFGQGLAAPDFNGDGVIDLAIGTGIVGKAYMVFGGPQFGPAPPLAGDFNGNGHVEQGDLDLVLLSWGQPAFPPPGAWTGDFPDGNIDQSELDRVLLNWGNESARTSAVAARAAALPLASMEQTIDTLAKSLASRDRTDCRSYAPAARARYSSPTLLKQEPALNLGKPGAVSGRLSGAAESIASSAEHPLASFVQIDAPLV